MLENKSAYNAMNIPRVFREFLIRCGKVGEIGVLPLRECLIEISRSWKEIGFGGECPYSLTKDDLLTHERQFEEYSEWNKVQRLAQEILQTDSEGWISPEIDIDERRRQNRMLFSMYIEQMEGVRSVEEVRRMWPFLEDG